MKRHEKLKAWKEMCRKEAKKGNINLADGRFGKGPGNAMTRDQLAGYRAD